MSNVIKNVIALSLVSFLVGCSAMGEKMQEWSRPNPEEVGKVVKWYCDEEATEGRTAWAVTVKESARPHGVSVDCDNQKGVNKAN